MATAVRAPIDRGDGTFEIPLTHGKSAIIDACDLPLVAGRNWFAHMRTKKPTWYATGVVDGKQVRMHRHIMGLQPGDPRQGDHIDGDVANNRRSNLRVVDNRQNNRNRRTAVGKVGLKGVTRQNNRYYASITTGLSKTHLGTFADPIKAALAYDAAATEHFGEFAATNASLGLLEAAQ